MLYWLVLLTLLSSARSEDIWDAVPEFIIDLDEPASTRYNEVFFHFRELLPKMENIFFYTMAEEYREFFKENEAAFKDLHPEVYDSMASLASILGLPVHQTLLVNSIVDFSSYCTSIVFKQVDGTLVHSRNLDFDFPSVMVDLVYNAKIKSKGAIIGEAPCIAGYMGIYTGVKYGQFTVTYNVRYPRVPGGIEQNLQNELNSDYWQVQMLIQDVFVNANTYQEAVEALKTSFTVQLGYIIVGGLKENEGIIIAREREETVKTVALGEGAAPWFIVQTNEDTWDDYDPRYEAAVSYMNQLGQERANPNSVVTEVLWQQGVAESITIFSASLSAKSNLNEIALFAESKSYLAEEPLISE